MVLFWRFLEHRKPRLPKFRNPRLATSPVTGSRTRRRRSCPAWFQPKNTKDLAVRAGEDQVMGLSRRKRHTYSSYARPRRGDGGKRKNESDQELLVKFNWQ